MREVRYQTPHGINVSRLTSKLPYRKGFGRFLRDLDEYRGVYLSSGYEYPGRYSRWDIVSVRPPLELIGFQREVTFRPLNERGVAINRMLATVLRDHPHWDDFREENWRAAWHASSRCRSCSRRKNAASSRPYSPFCARSPANFAASMTTSSRSPARSDTTCCFSSSPSRSVFPATAARTFSSSSATTSSTWIASGNRSNGSPSSSSRTEFRRAGWSARANA